jgi:hypothetical protein
MIWHTQADGLLLGVEQSSRDLVTGGEDERVGAGRERLQKPVDRGIKPGVGSRFGQIPADDGEVVAIRNLANLDDPREGALLSDPTAQRVRRIGGVDDDPAVEQDAYGLLNEPRLRGLGMDREKLGHGSSGGNGPPMLSPIAEIGHPTARPGSAFR